MQLSGLPILLACACIAWSGSSPASFGVGKSQIIISPTSETELFSHNVSAGYTMVNSSLRSKTILTRPSQGVCQLLLDHRSVPLARICFFICFYFLFLKFLLSLRATQVTRSPEAAPSAASTMPFGASTLTARQRPRCRCK